MPPKVLLSHSHRDSRRCFEVAEQLRRRDVEVWQGDGPVEEHAVKGCDALVVVCSDDALQSIDVRRDVLFAIMNDRPVLPLLIETPSRKDQFEYWRERWQVVDATADDGKWLDELVSAIASIGVKAALPRRRPLAGFQALARFSDQIWAMPFDQMDREPASALPWRVDFRQARPTLRLGSRVGMVIESDRAGHLLLLDDGPEGRLYCQVPSWSAPDTKIQAGLNYYPQIGASVDSFLISGEPGREQMLAIITDRPLGLDWMTPNPRWPAKILHNYDLWDIAQRLVALPPHEWDAFATWCEVRS